MKNHKFNDAMDIFAKMSEGWNIVTYKMKVLPLTSANPDNGLIFNKTSAFQENEISHIEQTKPMNGDEVWAYDDETNKEFGTRGRYIGTAFCGRFACENSDGYIEKYRHVELIAPFKTLTIEEAEKMLTELTKENHKITR